MNLLKKKNKFKFTTERIIQTYQKSVKVFFKYILLSFIISTFTLCREDVSAQLIYRNSSPLNDFELNPAKESIYSPAPRRGFKKRRYGRYTFAIEAGYFYGYYEGIRYSLNFDLLAQSGENNALTVRLGYGVNKATNDSTYKGDESFVPIGINILIGRKNNFEIGGGIFYYLDRKKPIPYFSLGFRHQNPKGGFMYRVAVDINFERSYDSKDKEIGKTGVYGPIVGLGWTF